MGFYNGEETGRETPSYAKETSGDHETEVKTALRFVQEAGRHHVLPHQCEVSVRSFSRKYPGGRKVGRGACGMTSPETLATPPRPPDGRTDRRQSGLTDGVLVAVLLAGQHLHASGLQLDGLFHWKRPERAVSRGAWRETRAQCLCRPFLLSRESGQRVTSEEVKMQSKGG